MQIDNYKIKTIDMIVLFTILTDINRLPLLFTLHVMELSCWVDANEK